MTEFFYAIFQTHASNSFSPSPAGSCPGGCIALGTDVLRGCWYCLKQTLNCYYPPKNLNPWGTNLGQGWGRATERQRFPHNNNNMNETCTYLLKSYLHMTKKWCRIYFKILTSDNPYLQCNTADINVKSYTNTCSQKTDLL